MLGDQIGNYQLSASAMVVAGIYGLTLTGLRKQKVAVKGIVRRASYSVNLLIDR